MSQKMIDRINNYSLTHMDCIEKAICCMLNEYDENWASIYLMYNNWLRCFSLDSQTESEIGCLEYLCGMKILPLNFHTKKAVGTSVTKKIEKLLEKGALCLVPANLYELFYSKHFHNNNWPHLIFVRQCNKDEHLLYIMDSCQKEENVERFSPFVMEYDKLDKIYKSYCDTFSENIMYHESDVFYYFYLDSENTNELNISMLGKNLLEQVAEIYEGQKEKQLLKILLKEQTSYTKEVRDNINSYLDDCKIKFNKIIKRKMVFYTETIYSLFSQNVYSLKLFQDKLTKLIGTWNSFYRAMISGLLRKQTVDLWEKLEHIIEKEKDFLNEMLQSIEDYSKEMDKQAEWCIEHDEPGEIIINKNIIHMQTNKNHNAWDKDEALEVICYNKRGKTFHESFQVKTKIISGFGQNNFHAGIVIKTKDERMYVWGCYNEENLRLSNIGIKVDMKEFNISNLLKLNLSAIVDNENLHLIAKNDVGELKEVILENVVPSIKELGVILKTWENDSQENVEVEFEVIKSNLNIC